MATLRWTNFFKLLDANKNGTVEKSDCKQAAKLLTNGGKLTAAQVNQIETACEDMRIDGILAAGNSKKMTLDQVLATCTPLFVGKTFDQAPQWFLNAVTAIFKAIDVNKNGFVEESEYVSLITGIVPSVTPAMAQATFQQTASGKVDLPTVQKNSWTWASSANAVPEDVMLTLAVSQFA